MHLFCIISPLPRPGPTSRRVCVIEDGIPPRKVPGREEKFYVPLTQPSSILHMATMSPPYKPVLRRIVVPPPRPQEDVPPLGVVGAVGEELGLQAHSLAGGVASAALAPPAGVQEVGGVELDSRLLRPGLHHDAGPVPGQPGGQPEPLGGVQNEVVVIAAAAAQLGVIRADVPAQGLFGGEVEGG